MKERLTDIKVGFFVFLGILLICMMILLVGSDRLFFKTDYTVFAKFENIMGLQKGAKVRLSGYNIGTVKNIFFSATPGDTYVIVELSLDATKRKYIREDSKASINTIGVLGDKYIELTFGGPDKQILDPGAFVRTESPRELTDYMNRLGGVLAKIDNIMSFIDERLQSYQKEGTLKNITDNLEKITSNLASLTTEIKDGKGILHNLVYEEQDGKNLSTTLSELKEITWKINRGKGTIGALVNDPTAYEDLKAILSGASRSKTFKYLIRYSIQKAEEIKKGQVQEEE